MSRKLFSIGLKKIIVFVDQSSRSFFFMKKAGIILIIFLKETFFIDKIIII